jgi:hypothetical protein
MDNKIATPQELTTELQKILEQAQGTNPSRERIAEDLQSLAARIQHNAAMPSMSVQIFLKMLKDFKDAAKKLDDAWESLGMGTGEEDYPFRGEFGQVTRDIKDWYYTQQKLLWR